MEQKDAKAKILVVDDEGPIREMLRDILEQEGYAVQDVADGEEGLKTFFSWKPSLVVLDILMPKMDGWQLLERIREMSEAPVIVLSALAEERHAVRGLRSGADDYVSKPVRTSEFLARVEAALRKAKIGPRVEEAYRDRVLCVDFLRHQVYVEGREVALSPQEFRLLAALVRHAGMVLSTDQLLDLCWGTGEGGPELVRVYIGHLRKKLGEDPKNALLIETVREFGYRYRPPER
ncbi:MAG: response regulator transcription factor [Chloroflexi bacterium]|nr:response regulator transcription factor [Chloroflexota bacterium]